MMRFLRSAFVIARRDFSATVLSKAFIFFLLGPLFPLLLGGVFGGIGARVATQTERPVVAVVVRRSRFRSARRGARAARATRSATTAAGADRPSTRRSATLPRSSSACSPARDPPIRAVLTGGLGDPHLTGARRRRSGDRRPAEAAHSKRAMPRAASSRADRGDRRARRRPGSLVKDRAVTAQIGQMLLFFLTMLLSGMVLSQLIEEKSNKIIEVIAAAVPIDAMFVGKLFAMLAASVVGLVVWIGAGALLIQLIKHGGRRDAAPAGGRLAGVPRLAVIYFAMNYLLFGAAFLTIGAQASTAREVQTLSMPVTFAQVLIFGFAATAIGSPNSPEALAAAVFPLSSPMVMLARAAEQAANGGRTCRASCGRRCGSR